MMPADSVPSDDQVAVKVEQQEVAPSGEPTAPEKTDAVAAPAETEAPAVETTKPSEPSAVDTTPAGNKSETAPVAEATPVETKSEVAAPAETTPAPVASADKVEEMVTESADPVEAGKTTHEDQNAEVKMETSITEEKSTDEKAANATSPVTSAGGDALTNAEPTTQQPPQAPVSMPVGESKEKEPLAAEVKQAPVTNEQQPQQPQKQTDTQTLPTRQYLDATVVPILHSALSQLAKVRPEDPIQYLCTYLQEYKNNFTSDPK